MNAPHGERIAKRISRAGRASRREAERLIAEGRVAVNGHVLNTPAVTVTAEDRVEVDGETLPAAEEPRLWRWHKPRGCVATHRDPEGRPTVFAMLRAGHPDLPRVISVGRLDFNSEGLLLLTNDGELARHMERPATGWTRRYRVRAYGKPDGERLSALARGATIDDVRYGPIQVTVERGDGPNIWLTAALKEGKNREVRKTLEWAGLTVNRLIRVAFGPFQLGDLLPEGLEEVRRKVLRDQLGPEWATQFPSHANRRGRA